MPYNCPCSKKDCEECLAILGNCYTGCEGSAAKNPCKLCLIRMKWNEEKEEKARTGFCDCEWECDDDGPYVKWPCPSCELRESESNAADDAEEQEE